MGGKTMSKEHFRELAKIAKERGIRHAWTYDWTETHSRAENNLANLKDDFLYSMDGVRAQCVLATGALFGIGYGIYHLLKTYHVLD
ncbi:MAG: hypothetical protein HZB66_00840 [Candidatus Aenigmarchaeota archaeon]|nr:hypothetical protein [Candidatus Aenigmarchaeota archaeon]